MAVMAVNGVQSHFSTHLKSPQAHIGYGLAKACSELQLALGCSGGVENGGAVTVLSDIVHQVIQRLA